MPDIPSFDEFKKAQPQQAIPSFEDFQKQEAPSAPQKPGPIREAIGTAASDLNPLNLIGTARTLMHPSSAFTPESSMRPLAAPRQPSGVIDKLRFAMAGGQPENTPAMRTPQPSVPELAGHVLAAGVAPTVLKGAGKALGAAAPPIAESALGVRPINRAYGRTPGLAALEETSGVRPGTIAEQAQGKLTGINKNLEHVVGQSTTPVDIGPARTRLSDAESVARGKNARKTVEQLKPMQQHLSTDMNTQLPLSQAQSPSGALALKRGFGDEFIHNWNPETMKGTRGTAAQTYHDLAEGLHKSVPESVELDKRASSLIPVAERAAGKDLGAPFGQRIAGRLAAHTGALVGAGLGYQHGGIPGGLAGLVIPEMLASPTAQMVAARGLHGAGKILKSPGAGRLAPALALANASQERDRR